MRVSATSAADAAIETLPLIANVDNFRFDDRHGSRGRLSVAQTTPVVRVAGAGVGELVVDTGAVIALVVRACVHRKFAQFTRETGGTLTREVRGCCDASSEVLTRVRITHHVVCREEEVIVKKIDSGK